MPRVSGMRELKLLKVDGSNIREMRAESLKDLPALRYFHLAQSKLARLDIGVLEDLHYLVLANFTGNAINWVHPRAFRYISKTRILLGSWTSSCTRSLEF